MKKYIGEVSPEEVEVLTTITGNVNDEIYSPILQETEDVQSVQQFGSGILQPRKMEEFEMWCFRKII